MRIRGVSYETGDKRGRGGIPDHIVTQHNATVGVGLFSIAVRCNVSNLDTKKMRMGVL